jgi:hypothetical protein
MVKLKAKDAYVLGRVAQYKGLSTADRLEILKGVTSPEARQIGNVIIHGRYKSTNAGSVKIRNAAKRIRDWASSNRVFVYAEAERKR